MLGSTEISTIRIPIRLPQDFSRQARQQPCLSQLLPNGLVLISGGNNNSSAIGISRRISFLGRASMIQRRIPSRRPRSKINATSGGNQSLLWTGSSLTAGGGTKRSRALYSPDAGTPETWQRATGNMVTARTIHRINLLDDGRVLITGGLDSAGQSVGVGGVVAII